KWRDEERFVSDRHVLKSGRFFKLGGNLADEFVGRDTFTDRKLEGLANGVTNGRRDAHGRFSCAGQVKVTLVNRADLDVRCEIVRIGKHQSRKQLIFFKIARHHDESIAKSSCPYAGHGGVNAKFAGV